LNQVIEKSFGSRFRRGTTWGALSAIIVLVDFLTYSHVVIEEC